MEVAEVFMPFHGMPAVFFPCLGSYGREHIVLTQEKIVIFQKIPKSKRTNALFLKQSILSQLTGKKPNPKFYVFVKTFIFITKVYLVVKHS